MNETLNIIFQLMYNSLTPAVSKSKQRLEPEDVEHILFETPIIWISYE